MTPTHEVGGAIARHVHIGFTLVLTAAAPLTVARQSAPLTRAILIAFPPWVIILIAIENDASGSAHLQPLPY